MKILQMTYGLRAGGAEAFVTNLNSCRDVFEEPFDFLLYEPYCRDDFYVPVNEEMGSHVYSVGNRLSSCFLLACIQKRVRAYRFLKQHPYDVIHIHNSEAAGMLEAVLAGMAGVPKIVMHSHSAPVNTGTSVRNVKDLMQKYGKKFWTVTTDDLCACSAEAGNWLYGPKLTQSGKVHILPNGIQADRYFYDEEVRSIYRKKLNWEDQYIIGHAGRLTGVKNHSFLLDIFRSIHAGEPRARLLLLGTGELMPELRQKAKALGISEYVNFYGLTPEVPQFLQAMDLFLFPSLYEGLPLAGIEAQAAGLPVLCSDTISAELAVTDRVAWMSLEQNADQWAERAIQLMKLPHTDTRRELRRAGYDIHSTAQKLKNIYGS